MKVRDLKNRLEILIEESKVMPQLIKISHWVNKIHKEKNGEYMTTEPSEIAALKQIGKLGIFELEDQKGATFVKLTEEGKELCNDFVGHGYF